MKKEIKKLVCSLKENKITLALAESMTCGLAAHQLSTFPGTSDVLKGSVVCYMPEVKKSLFGISTNRIDKYTCESKEITEDLVRKLPKLITADIYAAVTGLASPGGSETREKPVGTVFFSVRVKKKNYNERRLFRGSPLEIRKKACEALYELIYQIAERTLLKKKGDHK